MMNDHADRRAIARFASLPLRSIAVTAAGLLVPAIASACTVCDSETGQQVRAGIFGGDVWSAMLAVLAPFAFTLAAVALVLSALFRGPTRVAANPEAPLSS
jgi:hypothetical protein